MLNNLLSQTVVSSQFSFFGHPLTMDLSGYGIAVVLSSIILYTLYIKRLFAREVPPPISTWGLWLLLDIAATYAEFSRGVCNLQLITYTIGTAIVCGALLMRLNTAWDKLWDTVVTLCVAVSIVVVLVTDDPLLGLVVSLAGITVATLPLLYAIIGGADEPADAWTIILIGSFFNYLDGHVLSSIWLGLCQITIVIAILASRGKRQVQHQ